MDPSVIQRWPGWGAIERRKNKQFGHVLVHPVERIDLEPVLSHNDSINIDEWLQASDWNRDVHVVYLLIAENLNGIRKYALC